MGKKWESLAVAALVSSSLSANGVEANNNVVEENGNKIEVVQENVKDTLKNDSTIAWEYVANLKENLKQDNNEMSKEELAQEMFKDGQDFNKIDSMMTNKIDEAINNNEPDEKIIGLMRTQEKLWEEEFGRVENLPRDNSLEECASASVMKCMATQTTHKYRISQRYVTSDEEYEQGKWNYGDFLEYLATKGDKKIVEALGVKEDQMTPENITMALAYGPKIPYEVQEQLYNEAKEDGRYEEYKKNFTSIGGDKERYPELSLTEAFPEGGARLSMGIEKMNEFADSIAQRYGENANALLVKAFTGDKELAEKLGFKDEFPDAQQLVYMLACSEPLSKEAQDEMVSPKDREVADKVLDYMENKNHKVDFFTLNTNEQKGYNTVQDVVDMFDKEQDNNKIKDLGDKLKDELSNIHPKTENIEKNNAMAVMFMMNRER